MSRLSEVVRAHQETVAEQELLGADISRRIAWAKIGRPNEFLPINAISASEISSDTNVHPTPESDPHDACRHASYDAAHTTGDALHASRQAWIVEAQAMAQQSEHPTNANTHLDAS